MQYTFADGKTVEVSVPEIEIENLHKYKNMFKVNLPSTQEQFIEGNGEGVWAFASSEAIKSWQKDANGEIHFVRLLNDSLYYPLLRIGNVVPIEMRGSKRPVVLVEELQFKYGPSKENEVKRFLLKEGGSVWTQNQ